MTLLRTLAALAALLPGFVVAAPATTHAPIDSKDLKILSRAPAIAVAGYRVVFVVRNGIAASADAGNVSAETLVSLAGVSSAQLQAIADDAYADLLRQLAATGRPVIDLQAMKGSKGFLKLETTPTSIDQPYTKKPFADSRTFATYTPGSLPLWWGHFDVPLGDKGPATLGNWRALNQLSVDQKCVVLVPKLTLDFAALKGSGHSTFGANASTEAKASLRVLEHETCLRVFHAKIALAGEGGVGHLKKSVPLADSAGRFVLRQEWGNQDEVRLANLFAAITPPGSGPSRSYSTKDLAYIADPAAFSAAVAEGAKAFNAMVASAVATYR
jgi:hypothetical protein